MNKISQQAAVDNLKRFYKNTPITSELALADLFVAADRDEFSEERNTGWLANKLTSIRKYGLIESIYSREGKKRLIGIRLTQNGLEALGSGGIANISREEISGPGAQQPKAEDTYEFLKDTAKRYQKSHPELTQILVKFDEAGRMEMSMTER